MSTSARLLVKPSTSNGGARPKKRPQQDRTILLDSDTSPSTSRIFQQRQPTPGRPRSRTRREMESPRRKHKPGPKSRAKRDALSYDRENNRRSSTSSATVSPVKKRSKKKGKSLKQRLRETVLDEGDDWRQRLRQIEEKNRILEDRLSAKKRLMIAQKQQHKREVENLTTDFKEQLEREQDKNAKEKAKMEKELKKMIKKAEKAELDLIKAESVKSSSAGSSNEALFQDMLGNLKDFLENQLQCSICNEIFVFPSAVNCGHTYCEECIEGWKKKTFNATCPICRAEVIMTSPNQILDGFIEKFIDNFFPEDSKKARAELVKDRKNQKEARLKDQETKVNTDQASGGQQNRHRIRASFLNDDDDSDDSDSDQGNWSRNFGFRIQLGQLSPEFHSPGPLSDSDSFGSPDRGQSPSIVYHFSSSSDESYQPGQELEDVDLSLVRNLASDSDTNNFHNEDESEDEFSHDDTDRDDDAETPDDDDDESGSGEAVFSDSD